ncbi:MAG TPA: phytanoyl-CoA dioxygenase family protein [Ohtaekwangia sp.]|uniref:phytanoyl-CoA dioxygenase family protein n=1 Tax=Ohtaekwangia sp. TaxID=2066019 RepID=UPI002F9395BC
MTPHTDRHPFLRELETPYLLSADAMRFYRDKGYIKLKDVFSKSLLTWYGDIITEWVFRLNTLTKPMEERTTYEKAFLQVMNMWREHDAIREFVFSKRLARIAAELMGVQGVRLYHDQALYKEPSGGITPWHADQFYWPLSNDNTITVWIPLQDTPLEMGPLAFAESSQHVAIGRDKEISDESEAMLAEALKQFPVHETPFELGEISFHSGWTYHRAGVNRSARPRKVMTMIYMDKDIRVIEPTNSYRMNDWKTWLDAVPVGSVANSKLNPILYSAG